MIAILSDIHGNLEALEAVLEDVAMHDVDAIYCLGDVIGYGPDPFDCLRYVMTWPVALRGNFDDGAVSDEDLAGWSALHACKTVLRFRSQLEQHPQRDFISQFLIDLPTSFVTEDAFYVHASPRNHLHEYLFPECIYDAKKMEAAAALFETLCFCGHTHIPGVFHQTVSLAWDYKTPEQCGDKYSISKYWDSIPDGKLICNVGSVGQPRDEDSRACYVLYAPDDITFRRVEYDVARTVQKIRDQGDDAPHGSRLFDGR